MPVAVLVVPGVVSAVPVVSAYQQVLGLWDEMVYSMIVLPVCQLFCWVVGLTVAF